MAKVDLPGEGVDVEEESRDLSERDLVELDRVEDILGQHKKERGSLISILQQTQGAYGYLPSEALRHVAERMGLSYSEVYGVATFYSQFYLTRRGRNVVKVCRGTACHVLGSSRILETIRQELAIDEGETTPDYAFTLEVVYCLGCCAISPVVLVNDEVIKRARPEQVREMLVQMRSSTESVEEVF
ncbi:NADH-quinone oxidoreductase subunit E [Candidatus Hakubella thermalkaliphila]|nr:NADH-quinone oxidoreductase subunit E [Candidatus Hakubella thermalkaliphila]